MKKHKSLLIFLAAAVLIGGVVTFGTTHAFAQSNGQGETLAQMIAQKFNLNPSDVQSVMSQYRQDRQTQMEANFKARLDQDVKDGKITADQETLILNKRQELQTNRKSEFANFKNMTPDQRKAAMQSQKQDLENWAKQNNIDIQYLFGFGMRGGMRGGQMQSQ